MIHLTLKSVPELEQLSSKERLRVHEQCLRRHFYFERATVRSVTAYIVSIFTVAIVVFLATSIPKFFGMTYHFWFVLLSTFIGVDIARCVFSWIAIPALRPFYREFIRRDEKQLA